MHVIYSTHSVGVAVSTETSLFTAVCCIFGLDAKHRA